MAPDLLLWYADGLSGIPVTTDLESQNNDTQNLQGATENQSSYQEPGKSKTER